MFDSIVKIAEINQFRYNENNYQVEFQTKQLFPEKLHMISSYMKSSIDNESEA